MSRAYRRSSQYMFGAVPVIHHKRSIHNLSHKHLLSTSMGRLTPILLEEVYPGDDFKVRANMVVRTSSAFLKPIMDNIFADIYFFYVPSRILYDDWEQIFGVAKPSQWTSPSYSVMPMIKTGVPDHSVVSSCSIADYFGLPVNADFMESGLGVSALPFRAYAKIFNDWFRDENLVDEVLIQTGGGGNDVEVFNDEPFSATNYTGMCANVAKLHDYFTQLLPKPQKGSSVQFPTVTQPAQVADVLTVSKNQPYNGIPLNFSSEQLLPMDDYPRLFGVLGNSGSGSTYQMGSARDTSSSGLDLSSAFMPSNLAAYVPAQQLGLFDVNDLRFAVQLQRMLEKDARSGSRYNEFIASHFNVTAPDARLQRSEYLGGKRVPVQIQQVAQTSQSSEDAPLGQVGAFSVTAGRSGYVHKGFVEHGYLIGLVAFRQFHTYQQGIRPFWRRFQREDFYDPIFAHLGEQPVYRSEIYANIPDDFDVVFGYKPPWEELRSSPNQISGQMRSEASQGFDVWHLGDNYTDAPVLGAEWITESTAGIDRVLSVESSVADNFICDFWFDEIAVRNLPTYGVPGLVDHD